MNRPQDERRLDDLARDLAADYNAPARELDEERRADIFARIQQERRRRVQPRTPAPRARRWQWAAAMVAVLLIGVAIGRWEPPASEAPPAQVADHPEPENRSSNLYRYAARDFLERTDNLLVMLQRAAYSPDPNPPFGSATNDPTVGWANTLLRETRLLQDSPAARDDPQLTQLLEDLELLLAQIVQATRDHEELEGNAVTDPAVLQRVRNEIHRSVATNEI